VPITVRGKTVKADFGGLRLGTSDFEYSDAYTRVSACPLIVKTTRVCPREVPWKAHFETTNGFEVAGIKLGGTVLVDVNASSQANFVTSTRLDGWGIGVSAYVEGWMDPKRRLFALAGSGSVSLPSPFPNISADVGISTRGAAACKGILGFGVIWSPFDFDLMWKGCGIGNYLEVKPPAHLASRGARAAQLPAGAPTASFPVTVPAKQSLVGFRAVGAGAPPKLVITPPDGSAPITSPLDATGASVDGRYVLIENPTDNSTVVQVVAPAAGVWKISSADPARALVSVQAGRYSPPPTATGSVTKPPRDGSPGRVLSLRYTKRPSDKVLISERSEGAGRTIVRNVKGKPCPGQSAEADADGVVRFCAEIPFRPTFGPGGVRRIEATVTDADGLPVKTLVAATFRVPKPATPSRPARVQLRRLPNNRLLAAWTPSANAAKYTVTVRLSDGRAIGVTPACRSAIIPKVAKAIGATVRVGGLRQDLVAGRTAIVRIKAGKKTAGPKRKVKAKTC
jgi:hypothetical protein